MDILSDTFWNATPSSPAEMLHQIDIMTYIIITTRTTRWISYGYYTTWILWHYNHNQNHEILHGYYMAISPDGYYDIIITTCSGMGSTPHSWYNGGRDFDLDGGMYKKSALNLLKICILCKSRLALFALSIFQGPKCAIMFDSVCICICIFVHSCIWTTRR